MSVDARMRTDFGFPSWLRAAVRAVSSDCDFYTQDGAVEYADKAYKAKYKTATSPGGFLSQVRTGHPCTFANVDAQVTAYGPPKASDTPAVESVERAQKDADKAASKAEQTGQSLAPTTSLTPQTYSLQTGLSTGAKVGIGVGAAAVLGTIVVIILRRR